MGISLPELDELPQVEVAALYKALAEDQTTRVGAIEQGLVFPVSVETMMQADVYDAVRMSNWSGKGKKPEPHPRPWLKKKTKGKSVKMTRSQSKAFWTKRGHRLDNESVNKK